MAVITVLRIPGNPSDLERYAAGPGRQVMQRIQAGKAAGAIRHTSAGGEGEISVIDEWPDQQSFEKFYASQPEIADVSATVARRERR